MRRLLAFLTLVLARSAVAQQPSQATYHQLGHAILRELIETNTTGSTGNTTIVADQLAVRFRDAGFPEADVQVVGPTPRDRNLIVRYRGSGARKPILLLAHLDVVEAKREDWTYDPFRLTEHDGYFYGRGTQDQKGGAASLVTALLRLKSESFVPDRDLILALTAGEEGGTSYNGVDWLIKNKRNLIDAEFALNEGGWGESAAGKPFANDVQFSEKYVINYRFEVHNKGGHSSLPVPDNAIYHLSGALDRLSKFAFPVKVNDITRAYFRAMSGIEKGPIAADLAKVANGDTAAMRRVAAATTAWNATLRTTSFGRAGKS